MTDNLHALVGSYAVDALDPAERDAFAAHLADCRDCRDELAGLRVATDQLAAAAAAAPPASLRERVLADARHSRREHSAAPAVARVRPLRPRRRTLAWVGGAAASVALVVVGAKVVDGALEDRAAVAALERDAMMVTTAPDASSMDLDLGTAHLVTSERMHGLVVMGADVPMPATGTEYQAWLILADGSYVAGPTFMPSSAGDVLAHMDAPMEDAMMFAITAEPAGGSATPTGPMLAEVPLA